MSSQFHRALILALGATAAGTAGGCGKSGPKVYTVTGRVANPEAAKFAGHSVEAALASDPQVRAFGTIGPDGQFTLETLDGGKILAGAKEGTYKARIVLSDDVVDGRKPARPPLPARFLHFQTSGLSFQVPADKEVQLAVAAK